VGGGDRGSAGELWSVQPASKATSGHPHLLLQIGKYLGFALVVPLAGLVGLALCVAQIGFRWIPYLRYRWMSAGPDRQPLVVTRLAIFLAIAIPSLLLVDHSPGEMLLFAVSLVLLSRRAAHNFHRRPRGRDQMPKTSFS
jgi:hypothetical protein